MVQLELVKVTLAPVASGGSASAAIAAPAPRITDARHGARRSPRFTISPPDTGHTPARQRRAFPRIVATAMPVPPNHDVSIAVPRRVSPPRFTGRPRNCFQVI